MTFTITPATADTIAARRDDLAALLVACVDEGASLGFFAPLARDRAGMVFAALEQRLAEGIARAALALVDDQLAGCIAIFAETRETEPHLAELGRLMVAPVHRRHGIAAALVGAAEIEARAWGKTRLYLFCTESGAAPALYDHCGYQRVGRIPEGGGLPDGTVVDALVFSKSLPPRPPAWPAGATPRSSG